MSKKKKIMTISDLYKFCIKNNFCHFSSSTDNEEICVQMPAIFEKEDNVDKDKEGLTPFVAKAYHDHINLNNSEIKPEVLESTLPSAMLRPILASIVTDEKTGEKDFGSHDFVFEEDEDGNEKIKYIEQPVGVIFGDNTIEYDEEDDVNRAILHGYLYNEYCQDAVDIMNRRKTVDCSVELSIREMSFNTADKVLTLEDFYVCGLTLLGSKVKPGMKGSKVTIEDFNKSNNSMFSNNEKVIELLETLNNTLSSFNKEQSSVQILSKEGGNDKNMDKFNELLEKYGKTAEDIDFEYEDMTDEELESKFEEVFGKLEENSTSEPSNDEGTDDGDESEENPEVKEDNACGGGGSGTTKKKKKNSVENEPMTKTYEISHDDIRYALYNLLSSYEESDNDWYYITGVYDSYFVYESWNGGKIYGQKYTKDNDNVAFDGERYTLHKEYLTDSEYAELQSMRSNYASLKEFKENAEKNELHAKREEILNSEKYESISETDAFKELVKNMDNYSLEELEKEAKIIFADNFNMETFAVHAEKAQKNSTVKVFANVNKSKKDSRYGNLFSK